MELRVLRYFLAVAREENITRAARLLHLSQPTLSRQLMQLEEELGVKLFLRTRHHISLTEEGYLLKRRAEEIITLADRTSYELSQDGHKLSGTIAIGSGELQSSAWLSGLIASFHEAHPEVSFSIFSGSSDSIKEQIENGILDLGLLQEPVDVSSYSFLRTPICERWGILAPDGMWPEPEKKARAKDVSRLPLILPGREHVQHELLNWFGAHAGSLDILATGNLQYNQAILAKATGACVLTIDLGCRYEGMSFIPLDPPLLSRTLLVWKKDQPSSAAVSAFLSHIKNASE